MATLRRALVPQRLRKVPREAREGGRGHAEGDPLAGGQGGRQGEGRPRRRKAAWNEAGDCRQICRGECRGDLVLYGLPSRALAQDTYKQRSGEDHEGDPTTDARRRQLPRRLFGHDASRGQAAAHIRHEMGHAPVSLLQNGILVIQ